MSLHPEVWTSPYWRALELQTGQTARDRPSSPTKKSPEKRKQLVDRFIPTRVGIDNDVAHLNLTKENNNPDGSDERERKEYEDLISHSLFDGQNQKRVLSFSPKKTPRIDGFENGLREVFDSNRTAAAPPRRANRYISQNPERILDAPELMDDFYLNLLDWNSENILAVALGQTVYLWNASNGHIQELMQAHRQEVRKADNWLLEETTICCTFGMSAGTPHASH